MTENPLWDESKAAPHGRDENNVPKTPFGVNRDGSPRKSNRGAKPGQRQGGSRGSRRARPGVKVGNRTDAARKQALCDLGEMLIVTPLAGLSASPQISARFGERHSAAFAGDAVIVANYLPPLADGLIVLSQSKPGALAWLDQVEEKAPYLMLASVGIALTKALAENHLNPNPDLAIAGRVMAQVRSQQMADQIMAQAREMGIPTDFGTPSQNGSEQNEPTVPIPQPA